MATQNVDESTPELTTSNYTTSSCSADESSRKQNVNKGNNDENVQLLNGDNIKENSSLNNSGINGIGCGTSLSIEDFGNHDIVCDSPKTNQTFNNNNDGNSGQNQNDGPVIVSPESKPPLSTTTDSIIEPPISYDKITTANKEIPFHPAVSAVALHNGQLSSGQNKNVKKTEKRRITFPENDENLRDCCDPPNPWKSGRLRSYYFDIVFKKDVIYIN